MVEPVEIDESGVKNLRTVTLSSLNWSVGLQSSFERDTLEIMLKKAIETLSELKKNDGCV